MNVGILSIALLTLSLKDGVVSLLQTSFHSWKVMIVLAKLQAIITFSLNNTNGKRYGYCICNSILGSLDKSINSSSVTYDTAVIDANKNKTPSLKIL